MFLKSIDINGFKSFANKTGLDINSGITGIVGPNGSGKSNIADAIRWVLGEQSSKNLRGAKMEDVIFNGSQTKSKKAFCEVSLTFDNEDGKMHSDYPEIVISRKMYRSGESEYMINNAQVRLKDVLDMIRDTGIGKEGYSIIGQGRVDEILESKPTARRKVFEEAAGIMKFRTRKEEAEKKLERADENLVRIEDILEELETQLGPMREQAECTRKYRALFDRQRVLDANIFLTNSERTEERLAKFKEELALIENEIETDDTADQFDSFGDEISQKIEAAEAECNSLAGELSSVASNIERSEGERKLAEERITNLEYEFTRAKTSSEAAQQKADSLKKAVEAERAKKDELEKLITENNGLIDGYVNEITEAERLFGEKKAAYTSAHKRRLELLDDISDIKSELSGLEAETSAYKRNIEQIEERIRRNEAEREAHKSTIDTEQEALRALDSERKNIASRINENNDETQKLYIEEDEKESRLEARKKSYNDSLAKKKLFLELQKEYEGYSDGVRRLMKDGSRLPELRGRIIGTFAELIKTPEKYEIALETLLGGALQNIVVHDEYDAKECIEYLRRNELGRVTFLPTQSLRVNYLTDAERRICEKHGGFLAVASEALSYGAEAAPAVEFLLARTIIVEDMDSGIEIMREADYSFRAVTLKGDVLRPGGSISGGSTGKKRFGLLSRERQIADADTLIEKAKEELDEAQKDYDLTEKAIADMKTAAEKLLAELKKNDKAVSAQREKIASGDALFQSAYSSGVVLQSQLALAKSDGGALIEKHEALSSRLAVSNTELENVMAALEYNDTTENDAGSAELSEKVNELRVENAARSAELEAAESNITRLNAEIDEAEKVLEKSAALNADTGEMRKKQDERLAAIKAETEALRVQYRELGSRKEKADSERIELKEIFARHQKEASESRLKYTSLMERKYKLESQIEKCGVALEAQSERLWESYEMTMADALALKTAINYQAASNEVRDIREEIRELGVINPNAVEDYEKLSARANEMQSQREDLIKAELDLHTVIDDLMQKMKETFSVKFDMINEHFQTIFSELFGGGRAELSLDDGDIMECGINIAAEPPGKRLQHISLLSGGERALTAIALLFAMLRINPSPVCLLDEIDAPLDEANVVRFSQYLRHITDTQFLVITHRKPTIMACDTLYGVAMEEKGVSGMVSVKLK